MSLTADDMLAWETALDELDPPPRDVFAEIGYTPTAKQRVFHDATEHDVLFGGSLGGGKSRALMAEAIRACAVYPGMRVGAFRRTYGELKESLVPELAAMGFGQAVGGRWNGTEYELRFANGSLLMLRYAENLVDATRRQGGQYQLLMFDERTLVNPDVCGFLESRVRSGRVDIPVLGIRSTANPGGPGHGAVRQRYIDATDYGANVITDPDTGHTIRFIPSSMRDNPHLDAGYERRLASLPEAMRRAMRDGDWGVFTGQVFCYDNRVEILTETGWKPVAAVETGEPVATLAPDGRMTFAPATRVWKFQFDGELHVHEGRALNFAVTPGHRMWTRSNKTNGPFRFVPVEDLPDVSVHLRAAATWPGVSPDTVTVTAPGCEPIADEQPEPGCCRACYMPTSVPRKGMCDPCYRAWNNAGRPDDLAEFRAARANPVARVAKVKEYTFDTGDWCELLGWYISEGFTTRASSGSRYAGRIYGFGIAQVKDPEKIARIRSLLDRMGLTHTFDGRRFRIASTVLGAYFKQFGHHADKFIPREVLGYQVADLRRLFDALMAGDGCLLRSDEDAWLYVTSSRQLADDVQELCVRLNRVASIAEVPEKGKRATHYRVSVYKSEHDRSVVKRSAIRREPYSGQVSCVTVEPHHTVLVRRGGKAMWCGNTEWNRDRHIVPRIQLPSSWKRACGIDYGWTAPWVVIWGAQDEDKRVWLYREITAQKVIERDQAARIIAAEASDEQVSFRAADPAMWARTGEAQSVADQYAAAGVRLTKADNSRLTGKQRVHSFLADGPACQHHRALGWDECPRLHVLDGTCPELVRTLPMLPYDPRKPEDVDTAAEDHHFDAARYLLMALGQSVPSIRWM